MRYVTLIALTFIVGLSLYAGQDKRQPENAHRQATQNTDSTQPESAPVKQMASQQGQTTPEQEYRAPRVEPKPWLTHGEWVMAILTGIYVMITGFYAWVSHKTLDAIERQAKDQAKSGEEQIKLAREAAEAAQRSADAALLNAQAVINAERPWIIIVAEENGAGDFTFKARNHGRTPAEIVSFSSEITFVVDDVNNLPLPPKYTWAYLSDVTILVPAGTGDAEGNEFGLLWYAADAYLSEMDKEKVDAINQGKLRYVFYFKVVYRNTLNKAGLHIPNYETCRGFWYSPKVAHIRTDRVPHEYNRST